MTPSEKSSNRLLAHRDALIKLGDEFGEPGNQYEISAGEWLRPVIMDFIQTVQDRYDSIAKFAENNTTIQKEIVHAADEFFDSAVETILRVYPAPVRSKVRGITSQIRNELAILRIDTKSLVEEKLAQNIDSEESVKQDVDWKKKIVAINNDPIKFKAFLENEKAYGTAAAYIIFSNVMLTDPEHSANFYKLALECTKRDKQNEASDNQDAKRENHYDAFRRYWLSLPAGNLLLAMATKKLLEDQALLEHVIRRRIDIKNLLLNYLPTVELRHHAIQLILKCNYLDSRNVSRLYDLLPEGNKVNGRIDAALYGIKKYLAQPASATTDIEWDNSKQKIRAETFEKLLDNSAKTPAFVKKVIVYALLLSEGKKLQHQVYRIMGYPQLDVARKNFKDSIRFDAERMKIDFNQLSEEVIHTIITNTNAKKTFESGAYSKPLEKLAKLTTSSQEIF
jgi:hypothetical protein